MEIGTYFLLANFGVGALRIFTWVLFILFLSSYFLRERFWWYCRGFYQAFFSWFFWVCVADFAGVLVLGLVFGGIFLKLFSGAIIPMIIIVCAYYSLRKRFGG